MHPEHDQVRRTLRAQYLSETWDQHPATIYVDAADPNNGVTKAAACSSSGRPIAMASNKTTDPTRAEEVVIALAISAHPRAIIMTDSKEACRNFNRGGVCRQELIKNGYALSENSRLEVTAIFFVFVCLSYLI